MLELDLVVTIIELNSFLVKGVPDECFNTLKNSWRSGITWLWPEVIVMMLMMMMMVVLDGGHRQCKQGVADNKQCIQAQAS